MFKDYYQILGISSSSSPLQIKQAYRAMSMKWHPDRNPDADVTGMMQDINEAYKILKDEASRAKYDAEYQIFTRQQKSQQTQKPQCQSWNYDYDVKDEDLKKDMDEARTYAKDLVDEFFKHLKETSKVAAKGAWEESRGYIWSGIIITLIFALIKSCN